jgi:hypothetical protein
MEFDQAAVSEQINTGKRAAYELSLVASVLEEIKSSAVKRVMSSGTDDKINNERLIVTYQIVEAIQGRLEQLTNVGAGAETLLSEILDGQ